MKHQVITGYMRGVLSCFFLSFFIVTSVSVKGADNLGSNLRKTGWDRMVGTWVDQETNGKKLKMVTAWKFKDHVLETHTTDFQQKKKDLSLMGYDPKKGEVYHFGADDKGGTSIGSWALMKDEAVLDLGFVTATKMEGLLQVRYTLVDDDTLLITIILPEPIVIRMIRVNETKKAAKAENKAKENIEK